MQFYSVASTSLQPPSKPVELKIPLWWADGTDMGTSATTSGSVFVADGTTTATASSATSTQIYTHGSSWPANTVFAFEATVSQSNASYVGNFAIWDFTANAIVSGSQISTSSTTYQVLRSGQFTLTPGHVYGVTVWINASTYAARISDASLIVFP